MPAGRDVEALKNEFEDKGAAMNKSHTLGYNKVYLIIVYLYHNGTRLNNNDMLIISSREFRQNQREYFERADMGEQIIVQRGKDKAYALTPITKDDLYFNADMVKKIKQSIRQAEQGKTRKVTSPEEITKLLGL